MQFLPLQTVPQVIEHFINNLLRTFVQHPGHPFLFLFGQLIQTASHPPADFLRCPAADLLDARYKIPARVPVGKFCCLNSQKMRCLCLQSVCLIRFPAALKRVDIIKRYAFQLCDFFLDRKSVV